MNGKQSKKLREMSAIIFQLQPKDIPNRKSLSQIYSELKIVHKNRTHGNIQNKKVIAGTNNQ